MPADLTHIMDNAPGCLHKWKSHERRRCCDAYDFCVDRALEDWKKYNLFKGKFPFEHLEPPYDLGVEELARIRPIVDHYHVRFCEADAELSGYLWDWLASAAAPRRQDRGRRRGHGGLVMGLSHRALPNSLS